MGNGKSECEKDGESEIWSERRECGRDSEWKTGFSKFVWDKMRSGSVWGMGLVRWGVVVGDGRVIVGSVWVAVVIVGDESDFGRMGLWGDGSDRGGVTEWWAVILDEEKVIVGVNVA